MYKHMLKILGKYSRILQDILLTNKKSDDHNEYNEIVIIGGGYLFRDTLKITNKLVLTNVNCEIEGDVFYPDIDFSEWQEKSSENFSKDIDNDYDFKVRVLERV